jgi:AcrR family transcriptional regulator
MFMNTRSRPARGSRLTGGAIRSRLLDAADDLLAARRPGAITSRDIARAGGLSDGVLYNHFADKGDLLLTAMVRRFEGLIGVFEADPPRPGAGSVADGVRDFVARSHALQIAALPMLANLAGDPPLLHRFMTAIHTPPLGGDRFRRPIIDWLAGERALGRIGPVDADAVADVLVGAVLMQGLIDVLGHRPDRVAAERLDGIGAVLLTAIAHCAGPAEPTPPPTTKET